MEEKHNLEVRRLVLAKMFYRHGCTCASRKDTLSRMLAIQHFDYAVEMILRCAATKRGTKSGKKQLYFEDLLEEIGDMPLKEQMTGLHRVRNAVQHHGDVPSTESVMKYRGYAEDFFREICKEAFGVPYEALFLSELIENENLRQQAGWRRRWPFSVCDLPKGISPGGALARLRYLRYQQYEGG